MSELKLNLCSIGEPTDPRTWSGTPFNIYSELKKRGQCGDAFNADIPDRLKPLFSLLSVPLYGKFDLGRTPIRRYACAYRVEKKTKASTSLHTLHTGTLSLPFVVLPQKQYHYLFCDSTWNLWSRHETNMDNYSKRGIAQFDRLDKRVYLQMNHIFTISHYVKENLIDYYKVPAEKITVVGTGLGVISPFFGKKLF